MDDDGSPFDDLDSYLSPDQRPRFFVALFRLPNQLPLPHGDSYAFQLPGDLGDGWDVEADISPAHGVKPIRTNLRIPSVSIHVWQPLGPPAAPRFDAVQKVAGSIFPNFEQIDLSDDGKGDDTEPHETVVEGVTQFARREEDPDDQSLTSICFDRCLTGVNLLLKAVSVTLKDAALHALAPEELDLLSLVGSRPIDAGFDVEPSILMMHWGIPYQRPILTDDERNAVVNAVSVAMQGHPFLNYMHLKKSAERALATGDHAQTAIFAAVSLEVALNVLLRALLVELGKAPTEVQAKFNDERGGFAARLRRDYAPLVGGIWRPDDPTTEVGRWVAEAQGLRHRVVHAGFQPSRRQAADALDASAVLESFVMDRVAEKRYKFPMTTLSLLGQTSLARRGHWNGKMQRLARELNSDLPAFWELIRQTE